jgi:hypothetical protein
MKKLIRLCFPFQLFFFKQKKVTVVHKANIMKLADGVTCIAFQSLLLLILCIYFKIILILIFSFGMITAILLMSLFFRCMNHMYILF